MKTPPPSIIRLVGLEALTRFEHEAMNTTFTLHLGPTSDGSPLRPIAEEAFRLLDRLEQKLSFYQEGSDVTRINRAQPDETFRINEVTHRCLLNAIEVSGVTAGAFDPFAGYASLAAKSQSIPHHLTGIVPPGADDQRPVLSISPDQPMVTKLAGQRWLDLGAVGKGAALDALAELLSDWDVSTAVLSGGGSSLLVLGDPPDGDATGKWHLQLPQSPGSPSLKLAAPFALGASGDGFQPGHIVGGSGGQTARPQSLVLAPNAALADALSTAAILLSDDELRAMIGDEPGFGVFATHASAPAVAAGALAEQLKTAGPDLALIIPCWCESERLPPFLAAVAGEIQQRQLPVEIIVVDDGSPAPEPKRTRKKVDELRARFPFLRAMLSLPRHQGKGGAIYHGWRNSSITVRWLGFVDADGAVPPSAVIEGVTIALAEKTNLPLIAANRYHRDPDHPVRRDWLRQRTGAWFARWARQKLRLRTHDSQCGFKIFPAQWWKSREQPSWKELGYAFDLELLLAAKADGLEARNLNISWSEIGGSNVGWRDGLELVQTVRRLARNR